MNSKRSKKLKYQSVHIPILILVIFHIAACETIDSSWLQKGVETFNTVNSSTGQGAVTDNEIKMAFKEALQIGTGTVVKQLGQTNGFNSDSAIHIPLPEKLNSVKTMLGKVGMSHLLSDLELKLNRAAEVATPKAKSLFIDAIMAMSFSDIKTIYNGPQDSATQYFKQKMTPSLAKTMRPIIENSLSQVGAINAYDKAIGQYQLHPFVPNIKMDLTNYVVEKGMDGIFHYVAIEEAAIRKDPVKQTTALLRRVFGSK